MYVLGNTLYADNGELLGEFSKHIAAIYAMWTISGDSNGLGYRMLSADDLEQVRRIQSSRDAKEDKKPEVDLAVYETEHAVARRIINEIA